MNLPADRSAPSANGIKLAGELDQLSKTIPTLNLKTVLVPTDFSENLFDEAAWRSEESLVRLSRDVQGSNVKIETLQRLGTPYEQIIKVARERGVDLIIIATHGYTGLKHFLLGSTTERVVRVSPCPVLVVRQEEQDFVS
jgi:universal stress protein A